MIASSRTNSHALLPPFLLSSLWVSCAGSPGDSPGGPSALEPAAAAPAAGLGALSVRPTDRLTGAIDTEIRRTLTGHRHPMARAEFDRGAAPDVRMEKMMLVLSPDQSQQEALSGLTQAQHDSSSPLYHQWLTPDTFAERFGASDGDIARVAQWLAAEGMTVDEVAKGNRLVLFSGSTRAVERAFRTTMRQYEVAGELHHANADDPSIPEALASVVSGVVSLHDFRSRASYAHREFTQAENTTYFGSIQQSAIVPADLAKIYDASPLYATGIDGSGQSIAVLGRSNIDVANVHSFRASYGLPTKDPVVVLAGSDPGIVCGGDEAEAYLDVEYAGAIAKQATIKFVVAASTQASDGIFLAAAYAVSHNVAPIVSLSYGLCERLLGSAGNSLFNGLWQQAAAQGMSVMVASMDSGAAGCDDMDAAVATGGLSVNGLGSTPWNTAVGGTQFADVANRAQYWAASNDPVTQASALGYIPELAWNESAGGGLYASGGGTSSKYAKPTWQFGLGVPPDGKRDIPDVAFAAAIQDPYKMVVDNQPFGGGGTSASTPVFASIMALVLQNLGQPQGLINPVLYALAYQQTNKAGAAVFHDVTSGNNSVPGQAGYSAGAGYDLVTGLGSVDVAQLVNHWQDGDALPNFGFVASSPSASVSTGATSTTSYTVRADNGFSSPVSFSVSGLPAGVTALFSPKSLTGSGSTNLALTAAANAAAGSFTVTVSATGGGSTQSLPLALTVVATPPLALTFSAQHIDIAAGSSGSATVKTVRGPTFNAAVTLSVSGLPQGVTGTLSVTSIKAPGAGASVLTVKVGAAVAGGSYLATVVASGGGARQVGYLQVNVLPAPSFSLTLSPTSLSASQGANASTVATTIRTTTFNAAVSLKVSGMPAGVVASLGSIAAPGSGMATLGLTVANTAAPGTYKLTVTATGGGVTKTAPLTLTVSGLSLSASTATLSLKRGGTATTTLTAVSQAGANVAVSPTVTGLPAGVTVTFKPGTSSAAGTSNTTVTFSAIASAKTGSATVTFTASAGTLVRSKSIVLRVL